MTNILIGQFSQSKINFKYHTQKIHFLICILELLGVNFQIPGKSVISTFESRSKAQNFYLQHWLKPLLF